ncbi:MAG: ABC transporter substrate-binding protein [Rhodospirillales bacterium]|nr:ABC transporter substrate-binding protein [Rhodospirillales bacterium]
MRIAMAALAACVLAAAPAALAAKTTLAIGSAAESAGQLDPDFATATTDRTPVGWMFNGLVRFRSGSMNPADIEPDLATSWESSADRLTWTFHLRHGVQFHAGFGELTADDVAFSLHKAADPKTSAFAADYAAFATVEAVDPYTVRIVLKHPVPSLLGLVTDYSGGYILSRKAYEQRGAGFTRAPVGTGPFAFDALAPNQSLTLVANDAYFRGRPQIRKIVYRYMPSDASRELAFRSGELDLAPGAQDQAWVRRMHAVPHAIVDVFEPGELSQLNLNITVRPLDDIRVRQAIAYAVDRQELLRWKGAEVARAPISVVPIDYLGTVDAQLYPHDPQKAKQLLAAAGYPNGLTIRMIHTELPDMMATMQVVQAQLRRVGITLDIQPVDHATYHKMIRQDLSPIVFYDAARFPIADIYLSQFFLSRSTVRTPTAVANFSHCNVADQEIEAARVATDAQQQLADWAEAQRKIAAAVCAVPLIETEQVWVQRDDVDLGYDLKGSLSLGPLITEKTHFK